MGGEREERTDSAVRAAIERMVDAHGADVLRLAFVLLKHRASAEDAFQEVFLRAYRGFERFQGNSLEKTWLIRIAINVCRDMRRSAWLRRMSPTPPENWESARDDAPTPEERALRAERSERLLRCVMSLSAPFREVIMLHYYEDLSVAEAAEALNVAEGTVRSRLHRARARLKRRWEEEGEAWDDFGRI